MKWLSAVVLSLVAVTVAPSPAGAVEERVPWPGGSICAQGSLTGQRTTTEPARTQLVWSIEPCPGTDPARVASARWGMASFFDAGAVAYSAGARTFGTEGRRAGRTPGFRDGQLSYGARGELRAVCLITQVTSRVACARVDAVGQAGTIVVEPVPVDDPLVSRAVEVIDVYGRPDPECAACV